MIGIRSVSCVRFRIRLYARPATMSLKILTLTTVYPTPLEPGLGIFVRSRLEHMAGHANVKVLTPRPLINYAGRTLNLRRDLAEGHSDSIERISPRWFYPPGGGALNGIFLFLQTVWPIARLRRRFRFDIIDAHFGHPEGVAAALLSLVFQCPFSITMRGSEHLHGQYRLRRTLMRWALRRANRVIPVSEELRRFAITLGADPARVITIPNGIDTGIFHPRNREMCRTEFGIPPGTRLVVSVGNLSELKGHHRTIRAVGSLADRGCNVQLWIAGGRGRAGDYEPVLRREMADLKLEDRVRLVGHLDREAVAKLVSAADVFCLASEREGWPNVVHEALACGTPVVATRVGGVPEMIPSEQYGIVVPPGDQDALTAALEKALTRTWDREASAALGQARSWQQVATEVVRQMELACREFGG